MSEFNETNWRDAISRVFARAVTDDQYRQLCLSDAKAAVAQVSDIDLPTGFKVEFVARHEDLSYSLVLPPALGGAAPTPAQIKQLIDWNVFCSSPTTN